MKYTKEEVLQFVLEEDVKFIRLAFTDVFGKLKNISIMPSELYRAFTKGVSIDASSVYGFGDEFKSDLFLHPDPDTLTILPWRPEHGRVVRMFCQITNPDGTVFSCDTRSLLIKTMEKAKECGVTFRFGTNMTFYLFKLTDDGEPTRIPHDHAGYMDLAPLDKGENVRREISLTLEQMGIQPVGSHHEAGPGQNKIAFHYDDPLTAADNAVTFRSVVQTIAARNGLFADFSPKPLENQPGSGMHIELSCDGLHTATKEMGHIRSGLLSHISEMTLFLNPVKESYDRLGKHKVSKYISWGYENRSALIRIPAAMKGDPNRFELRSPDSSSNPYLVFSLMILAALEGLKEELTDDLEAKSNLFKATREELSKYPILPETIEEAKESAKTSAFIKEVLSEELIDAYL